MKKFIAFARFIAYKEEFEAVPDEKFLGHIGKVSAENEADAWRVIDEAACEALERFPTT